ncbi:MAG: MerR family transcriptional regulator [Acidobacteriota bacterium]
MIDLDINELCKRAGVTPRTVHFYVQHGLLPPAGSTGPGARYGEGHVSRIKLIRLLQTQHLPLAEIAKRTKGLTDQQVDGLIAETVQRRARPAASALDYIRSVLSAADASKADAPRTARESIGTQQPAPALTPPARSQWERFTLADGIELHVRRPLSRGEQRQLDALMAAARTVFDSSDGGGQS